MPSFDAFCSLVEELVEELPEALFKDLNGGVLVSPKIKHHPQGRGQELLILGTYHHGGHLGRYITLYHGSLVQSFGHFSEAAFRHETEKVLRHELTHHWESLAGEKDLELEDQRFLQDYLGRRS